jgi:adenine deaminase
MENLIDVAKGDRPPDLLLRGAQLVNVFTGEIYPTNIAIAGEWISGVGEDYTEGREVLDLEGLFLAPGLINGHLHLESSLLSPGEYARLALPRGTTTVVLDPHEIANVLGVSGIHALIDASRDLPLDFFFMAPSCVPATHLEAAGASLSAKEIGKLLREPGVLGLGEMMNFPGVLNQDPEVFGKIRAARKALKSIDGHAPLLSGKSLNAYIASGIESDHECTRKEEAQEKLRLGMWLMIREGSAARNLKDLLPAVTPQNSRRCLFVLDDLEPADLLKRGEMDHLLRESTYRGLNPITAIQMATLNPAERFGFKDRGAIAPGRRADIIGLADLKEFRPRLVIKNGRVAAREGKAYPFRVKDWDERTLRTVRIKPLNDFSFDLPLRGEKAWAIGLVPDQILTRKLAVLVGKDTRGLVRSDPESDILKIAVVERHRASGRIGLGLVKGLGLKRGAVATSVAHDSHNVIVAGADDSDMKTAVQEIEKMQGGFVVVEEGKVLAGLPLPVAGLMSPQPAEAVAAGMESLNQAAREIGATPRNPFIALSFLALPVIPELRITDRGLVDVSEFRIIPPEA